MKTCSWSASRSIALSRIVVMLFLIALVLLDIFGHPFTRFVCEEFLRVNRGLYGGYVLLACLYLCSIPAYYLLYCMDKLLKNLSAEVVFIADNVRYLRHMSWCCVMAGLICLGCASVWSSLAILAVAAGFMALIVRVVKNVFEQAILMKDELDFTV